MLAEQTAACRGEALALGAWDFRPALGLIENHSDVAAGKVICEMGSAQVPIAPCTGPGCVCAA